ncbi:glycosyltransferase family 2 protein [Marinagarivorans cellulosilyticus]|uniref:Glycosyltransferase 2-like domain-containing protein n=1 Tax=Marinagarivorans cellulosilyticus TaxID=2721545 RepID=A0AAN2BKK4_9GAMM|nr:glycosyltransferase [Marinagarivorans cellulosilyticus]BCD98055.1 hypothetical protein MARGE09_P2256 [Marinagarivorans cellulosilyticus]
MNDICKVGVVVIGRNEGERLKVCLRSIPSGTPVVYVDSGSQDGSLEFAKGVGVTVISLDLTFKFTAARARNEGWRTLLAEYPSIEYIQFVDGDCELCQGWLTEAESFLGGNQRYAIACGRRRERYPEASPYNWICDVEWNTPVGDARSCGGDALIRVEAILLVGGYRDSLVAGEEPDMCLRLSDAGYSIRRMDLEMTLHDANIHRFGQWWMRAVRCGFAYANGAFLHGRGRHRHWVREMRRAAFWGGVLPLIVISLSCVFGWLGLLLLMLYVASFVKGGLNAPQSVDKPWLWSMFMLTSKFPEFIGVVSFYWGRLARVQSKIIEYK